MNKKAQAGLEYLLTYGWALILIVTFIGVLTFVVSSPSSDIFFKVEPSSKFLLKGATVYGDSAVIKLQNLTGGDITITSLSPVGYTNCKVDDKFPDDLPYSVRSGLQFTIECDRSATGEGSVSVGYSNYAGLEGTITITGSTPTGEVIIPPPGQECGDNVKEGTELCDGTDLAGQTCITKGYAGGDLACNLDCLSFDTSDCYTCDECNGVCRDPRCTVVQDPDCGASSCCGDGICADGESSFSCPQDCGGGGGGGEPCRDDGSGECICCPCGEEQCLGPFLLAVPPGGWPPGTGMLSDPGACVYLPCEENCEARCPAECWPGGNGGDCCFCPSGESLPQ